MGKSERESKLRTIAKLRRSLARHHRRILRMVSAYPAHKAALYKLAKFAAHMFRHINNILSWSGNGPLTSAEFSSSHRTRDR